MNLTPLSIEFIWEKILEIKKALSLLNPDEEVSFISINALEISINHQVQDELLRIGLVESTKGNCDILCLQPFTLAFQDRFDPSILLKQFIQLYLPYALLPYFTKAHPAGCFVISHFAQTLDGKIAPPSGNSKWIGNDENLIHAHRMRALCDAIMVGGNTYRIDLPKLNVRHVNGNNPKKVVLLGRRKMNDEKLPFTEGTIIFTDNPWKQEKLKFIELKVWQKNLEGILKTLQHEGIRSVYLEGGAVTTSKFLAQNKLDQVQVCLAPKILGDGVSAFSLSGIKEMKDSITLDNHQYFQLGNNIMFIGCPTKP